MPSTSEILLSSAGTHSGHEYVVLERQSFEDTHDYFVYIMPSETRVSRFQKYDEALRRYEVLKTQLGA